jgi:hypothetical protein
MPEPTLLSTANVGTTEGLIPALGAGGKLASSLLPSIALTETLSVANAAARLALTSTQAQGKIVIEADTGKSYGLVTGGNPATSGDWLQLGDRDITAADISDSTAAGRALLTAANAAAQITALGAATPASVETAKRSAITDPRFNSPGSIGVYAFIGDSQTAQSAPLGQYGSTWPAYAVSLSGREPNWLANGALMTWGTGGKSTRQLIDQGFIATMVSAAVTPTKIFYQEAANSASQGRTAVQYEADVREAIGLMAVNGNVPVILSAPSSYVPDHLADSSASIIAEYNSVLERVCRDLGLLFIDSRPDVEDPYYPGASYRGFSGEGALLGLHPQAAWHTRVGWNVAKIIKKFGTTPLIDAATILTGDNWATTPGLPLMGSFHSGAISTVQDSLGGSVRRARVRIKQTSKGFGTGDTGFIFTPATGVSLNSFEVVLRRDANFTNLSEPGQPIIAITPIIVDGGMKTLIQIKGETAGNTFTTTCAQIIAAFNAHPIASSFATASSSGTPGSNIPTGFSSTYPFFRLTTNKPTVSETMSDTTLVRAVAKIQSPRGALLPNIELRGYAAYGVTATVTNLASTSSAAVITSISGPLVPIQIATPWVAASEFRRFQVFVNVGGTDGDYFIWDAQIQTKAP